MVINLVNASDTYADAQHATSQKEVTCISPTLSHTGTEYWQKVVLSLTNRCSIAIDLNYLRIEFQDNQAIPAVWYSHPIDTPYPEIAQSSHAGTHSLILTFKHLSPDTQTGLAPDATVSLHYGTPKVGYQADSIALAREPLSSAQSPSKTAKRRDQPGRFGIPRLTLQTEADKKEFPARVIGYLPLNWNNSGRLQNSLPAPSELAEAGYTHILIAFAIFSKSPQCLLNLSCVRLSPKPEEMVALTSGDGSQKESLLTYVAQLRQRGVRVLLSLGGASSSFGTIDFAESFNHIQNGELSFDETVTAFVSSIENLLNKYHMEGIDIDVEHGLSVAPGQDLKAAASVPRCKKAFSLTTGLAPSTGSVCAMVAVIEALIANNPDLVISLAPQTLNIAANNRVAGQTLNYASLLAHVRDHVSWVGVQVYNSGGMYGPSGVLQAITADNQVNASVAMALNLMEPWSQQRPYRFLDNSAAMLRPDQIVLGFPASNGQFSDGLPTANLAKIKQALNCLNTGARCGTLATSMPRPGPIGGVFNWNVNFDRANNYDFARSLTGR